MVDPSGLEDKPSQAMAVDSMLRTVCNPVETIKKGTDDIQLSFEVFGDKPEKFNLPGTSISFAEAIKSLKLFPATCDFLTTASDGYLKSGVPGVAVELGAKAVGKYAEKIATASCLAYAQPIVLGCSPAGPLGFAVCEGAAVYGCVKGGDWVGDHFKSAASSVGHGFVADMQRFYESSVAEAANFFQRWENSLVQQQIDQLP